MPRSILPATARRLKKSKTENHPRPEMNAARPGMSKNVPDRANRWDRGRPFVLNRNRRSAPRGTFAPPGRDLFYLIRLDQTAGIDLFPFRRWAGAGTSAPARPPSVIAQGHAPLDGFAGVARRGASHKAPCATRGLRRSRASLNITGLLCNPRRFSFLCAFALVVRPLSPSSRLPALCCVLSLTSVSLAFPAAPPLGGPWPAPSGLAPATPGPLRSPFVRVFSRSARCSRSAPLSIPHPPLRRPPGSRLVAPLRLWPPPLDVGGGRHFRAASPPLDNPLPCK